MFLLRIKNGGEGETKTMLGEEKALDGQGDFQLDGFGARSRTLGRLGTEEKLLA